MTEYKEAVKHFRNYIGNDCYTDKMQRFCEIAIEAIKKEIPEKPEVYYDGYADGEAIWECYCPTCEEDLDWDCNKRCPKCGQVIDWSNDNG